MCSLREPVRTASKHGLVQRESLEALAGHLAVADPDRELAAAAFDEIGVTPVSSRIIAATRAAGDGSFKSRSNEFESAPSVPRVDQW